MPLYKPGAAEDYATRTRSGTLVKPRYPISDPRNPDYVPPQPRTQTYVAPAPTAPAQTQTRYPSTPPSGNVWNPPPLPQPGDPGYVTPMPDPPPLGNTDTQYEEAPAELEDLRQRRLEAALQAISASFGMQQGGLESQLRHLASVFDQERAGLVRQNDSQTRALQNQAAERGLGHSGIYARDAANQNAFFAEAEANLLGRLNPEAGNEGTEIRDILSAISLLAQQQEAAKAAATVESEQGALDIEQLLALFNAGLTSF